MTNKKLANFDGVEGKGYYLSPIAWENAQNPQLGFD